MSRKPQLRSATPRQARALLQKAGYILLRRTKHEFWTHPTTGDVQKIPYGSNTRIQRVKPENQPMYKEQLKFPTHICGECLKDLYGAGKCPWCGSRDVKEL